MTKKFICIHPRFAGLTSHHFNESAGLIEEFSRRQKEFLLFVNRRASDQIVAELHARPVLDDPTFRMEWSFEERSRRFSEMLHSEVDPYLRADDCVMMTVSTQLEAHALTQWLQEMPSDRMPWIVILFVSDRWNRYGRDEYERQIGEFLVLNAALSGLKSEDKRRLIFFTLTERLAKELGELLGTTVDVVPMPLPYGDPAMYPSTRSHPYLPRVGVLGGMRREKGSHLIPDIVRLSQQSHMDLEFLIHLAIDSLTQEEAEALGHVTQMPNVMVIRESMSQTSYNIALTSVDIAVFPYEIVPYRQRTSGVFAEAVAYGKPVVAPRGTWMAEQIEAGRATGVIFEDLRPESVALAIGRCVEDLGPLTQAAQALGVEWRKNNSISKFVNRIEDQIALRSDNGSIGIALIAESGVLEKQAILLCESIRKFAGKYANLPITVISPRIDRRPCSATRLRLSELGVSYLPLDITSIAPAYGVTFRIYAAAAFERLSTATKILFLDSDLLFSEEPDLELYGADVLARPVDVKGMCTTGYGDSNDPYWQILCTLCGLDYANLPTVETTVDKVIVKASYNGGFILADRKAGVFTRTLDYFIRSVNAGIAPFRGTGIRIRAAHGLVSELGSELWGSSQACLSLAIWGSGLTVRSPDLSHNFPLNHFDHLATEDRLTALKVIHYHHLFEEEAAQNPLLNGMANIPTEFMDWIAQKAPSLGCDTVYETKATNCETLIMNKRLVVVIGMHRSGTSAVTRALKVLGVDLGQNLMPPLLDQNPKGFWEDQDINDINVELLRLTTHGYHSNIPDQGWHSLAPIDDIFLNTKQHVIIRNRAITTLQEKTKNSSLFGIKNPRIARLMPFWKDVFKTLKYDINYIIVVRNPLSVAQSLKSRNGFDPEKSYYLWLLHMLPCMTETSEATRIVVDYDLLLEEPEPQLRRIAAKIGITNISNQVEDMETYVSKYLDRSLRHAYFKQEDLTSTPTIPVDVVETYSLLKKLARDEFCNDLSAVEETFSILNRRLQEISPLLQYLAVIEDRNFALNHAIQHRDQQLAHLVEQVILVSSKSGGETEQEIHCMMPLDPEEADLITVKAIRAPKVVVTQLLFTVKVVLKNPTKKRLASVGPFPFHISYHWLREDDMVYTYEGKRTMLVPALLPQSEGEYDVQVIAPAEAGIYRLHLVPLQEFVRWHDKTNNGKYAIEVKDGSDYSAWILQYDTMNDESRTKIFKDIDSWSVKPMISVLLPVHDPDLEYLTAMLDSVVNQLYPQWELCIADDASRSEDVRGLLRSYAAMDKRIRLALRSENGHIAAASNSALGLVTGDFIALCDHDDLLAEHALYEIAKAIRDHPNVGIIYSDMDKIDINGIRYDPYFKCDWNPQLFLSQNIIAHLDVYRTTLVEEVGGFRLGFEGAQDWDLALRCIERLDASQIVHLQKILYHWRAHPANTAYSQTAKPYASINAMKAIEEHLERRGISGVVEMVGSNMHRVRYRLPTIEPLVSIIIPIRNCYHLTKQCLQSIWERTKYSNYEILLVDNGSDDIETLEYIKSISMKKNVNVIRDESPYNYSSLNNAAVGFARGELIALINNDIEVISEEWLTEMVGLALQPGVGAVGAKLWFPNGTLQHGGMILGGVGVARNINGSYGREDRGYFGRLCMVQNMSAVTAACLVVTKSKYTSIGGLDETNLTVAFNDVDFCLRLTEQGYLNAWTPFAELFHVQSASRGLDDSGEKSKRFAREGSYMVQRWGERLSSDPAYNSNLALDQNLFQLAWPSRSEEDQILES